MLGFSCAHSDVRILSKQIQNSHQFVEAPDLHPLGAKDSEGDRNIFQQSSELSSLKSEFAIQWENCERKF